jgi:hypothetical protein
MKTSTTFGSIAVALLLGACSAPGEEPAGAADPVTGDDQEIKSTDCAIKNAATGAPLTTEELKGLNDPVARLVLGGSVCPKTFKEITKKLADNDAPCNVAPSAESFGLVGPSTRFVSETSQVLGKPDTFRAVFQRQCGKREAHDLFASTFGMSLEAGLPDSAEMIGRDARSGVFNYYAREDNEWRFFGSSKDYVTSGYDCDANGACVPKAAKAQRCAGCHTGGGLVMKELQSPWVHWEGDTRTPGVGKMFKQHPELGQRGDGIDLEFSVESGNDAWTKKRIEILKTQGTAELLRPLFCTVDVNLDSAGLDSVGSLPPSLFVDPAWDVFEFPTVSAKHYTALVAAAEQKVVDGSGTQLVGKKGPVTDTFFKLTFPSRPFKNLDAMHNRALLEQKIVDNDFVRDVLHVDFTRPIFSRARCDLLQFAPKLDAASMNPQAIKDGFKKNLAGQTSPAAKQLLANLETAGDAKAHTADVKRFFAACQARPKKALLREALAYASQLRSDFRALPIAEFAETLPVDKRTKPTDRAFDPNTCILK